MGKSTDDETVVQNSLIGSIFSNSLLVLGCSFVANGIYYPMSSFNVTSASANVSLLMILPGPFANSIDEHEDDDAYDDTYQNLVHFYMIKKILMKLIVMIVIIMLLIIIQNKTKQLNKNF